MSPLENAADHASGPGPWFIAARDGACSCCGHDIAEGDEIRADGFGSWEGRCCERARENEERAEREAAQRWDGTSDDMLPRWTDPANDPETIR